MYTPDTHYAAVALDAHLRANSSTIVPRNTRFPASAAHPASSTPPPPPVVRKPQEQHYSASGTPMVGGFKLLSTPKLTADRDNLHILTWGSVVHVTPLPQEDVRLEREAHGETGQSTVPACSVSAFTVKHNPREAAARRLSRFAAPVPAPVAPVTSFTPAAASTSGSRKRQIAALSPAARRMLGGLTPRHTPL
jgi:hypothetical protein